MSHIVLFPILTTPSCNNEAAVIELVLREIFIIFSISLLLFLLLGLRNGKVSANVLFIQS